MLVQPEGVGWIEVICGPMFSGKTEELIRRIKRAHIARQSVQVFKPVIDDRYSRTEICSHAGRTLEAVCVRDVSELRAAVRDTVMVVGIDEVQFFGDEVLALCEELADRGVRVICSGLDQDSAANPFGPMPDLMAMAEFITKQLSICVECGHPANRSHRVVDSTGGAQIQVGAADSYVALCRGCYNSARHLAAERARQTALPLSPISDSEDLS